MNIDIQHMEHGDLPFAYIVCATLMNELSIHELGYYGDIIENTLSFEDQADDPVWLQLQILPGARRIAPVQLTRGWDPRSIISDAVSLQGIDVIEMDGEAVMEANAICMRSKKFDWRSLAVRYAGLDEAQRFVEIVKQTSTIAEEQNGYVYFFGGFGWDYTINGYVSDESTAIFRASGMTVVTRHP